MFDLDQAWSLHPSVAIRTESFGALAYHYDNRKLNLLRSNELAELLGALGDHTSVRRALVDAGIDPGRWSAFERALAALAESDVIIEDAS